MANSTTVIDATEHLKKLFGIASESDKLVLTPTTAVAPTTNTSVATTPDPNKDDEMVEEDFHDVRDLHNRLLDKSKEALEGIMAIARQTDHPRAYEVVATLLKTTHDINANRLRLHSERRKAKYARVEAPVVPGANTTVNAIVFNGTSKELLEVLRTSRATEPATIDGEVVAKE
jgi:hypothetical protein